MPRQQFVARPSPLAKVSNTRPLSIDPTLGLIRDPQFWKRFSTAVHNDEAEKAMTELKEVDLEKNITGSSAGGEVNGAVAHSEKSAGSGGFARSGGGSAGSRSARSDTNSSNNSKGSDWLAKQHKKNRKVRLVCLIITFIVILVIIGTVLAVLYAKGEFA